MANTVIRLKKSAVPGELPSSLEHGELAINYADGKLYYKDNSNSIQQISSGNSFATINASGTVIIADLQNDVLSFNAGENIQITGDYINDSITISANLKSVFDQANAAYDRANSSNDVLYVAAAFQKANDAYDLASNVAPQIKPAFDTANAAFDKANNASANIGNTAPVGSNPGSLWWDTTLGRMFIYYNDGDSSQWVETSPSGGSVNITSLAANVAPYFMAGANTANAAYVHANAAYAKANAALPNTTGAVFEGNLNIKTDLYIGNNITNVSSIVFNTSTNRTPSVPGELTWSQDESTLRFDMGTTANVTAHIGQDLFYLVKNQSGSTINKGTVVRFAGTLGSSGRLLIAPAIANNSYPSKYVMGVAATNISDGDDGYVLAQGKLRGINTSSFSAGDILYVSPSTAGAFSNTIPTAPNNKITIAAVVHKHASSGVLEVRLTLGSKLNEDELVEINNLSDGDMLSYVSANGRFENTQVVKVGQSEIRSVSHLTGSVGPEIIDSFAMNTWRSAQYTITMTAGTNFGTTQISVLHDDTLAYMTEYGILNSNVTMGLFDVTVSSGNVNLRITPTDPVTTVKILRTTNK